MENIHRRREHVRGRGGFRVPVPCRIAQRTLHRQNEETVFLDVIGIIEDQIEPLQLTLVVQPVLAIAVQPHQQGITLRRFRNKQAVAKTLLSITVFAGTKEVRKGAWRTKEEPTCHNESHRRHRWSSVLCRRRAPPLR